MLVSVIIPVYNVEQYLCECVNMVLQQTYHRLEVILVDDGSTDGSPALCDDYQQQDGRVRVLHKQNGGLSDARNAGLRMSTGEYVLFLDADDVWGSADFVEQLVKQAKLTMPDVILFPMNRFEDKTTLPTTPALIYDAHDFTEPVVANIFKRLYQQNIFSMSACGKLLKRSILIENNIWFTRGLLGEDMDWVQQLLPRVRTMEYNNDVFYCYRVRRGSITTTLGEKNMRDFCWILETWQSYWESSEDENKTVYLGYLAYLYVTLVYNYYICNRAVRTSIHERVLRLSSLLDYSCARKSDRLVWLRRMFGVHGMLFIAGRVGKYRKTYKH